MSGGRAPISVPVRGMARRTSPMKEKRGTIRRKWVAGSFGSVPLYRQQARSGKSGFLSMQFFQRCACHLNR